MINNINNLDLKTLIEVTLEKIIADGCCGCVFMDREEWEQPCSLCARSHKDYYRYSERG